MLEIIGYVGAILLAICALPQAILSYNQGHSRGLDPFFVMSWLIGEVLMMCFVVQTVGTSGPLFFNYLLNTIVLLIIARYKFFPRRLPSTRR